MDRSPRASSGWPASGLWSAAGLLASPSTYMLLVALALTLVAKRRIYFGLDRTGASVLEPLGVVALDLVVFFGLTALFAACEVRWPRARWATVPLAALLLAGSAVNAAVLSIAGEQLSREAVALGVDRFGDVLAIAFEQARHLPLLPCLLAAIVAVALPIVLRVLLRRRDREHPVRAAAALCLIGLVCWVVAAPPRSTPQRRLAGNALLGLFRDGSTFIEPAFAPFAGGHETADTSPGNRLNVLLLVLESLRYDHTMLPGSESASRASTPNILGLAREGTWTSKMRAVVPHTTKSLFTMLCGRLPMMQRALMELTPDLGVECLPATLAARGYDTAFLQSAVGSFEQRPRLADNLGFGHFEAWEEIQGEPLGYLASDDESLAGALDRWLDGRTGDGQPFFAVLLTSATHHPYRLSRRVIERLGNVDPGALDDAERYARLIEAKDELVGETLEILDRRELRESTIVAVVGDHGEGFGAKGVREHDNNYYEEGLHVPLVVAGPGVPQRAIDHDASLVDLTPTLAELLGIDPAAWGEGPLNGRSILAEPLAGRRSWFACWYDGYCYGFVEGPTKVVVVPKDKDGFSFVLRSDPHERAPRPLTTDYLPALEEQKRILAATRLPVEGATLGEVRRYGEWVCPLDDLCRHPAMPDGGFFERPDRSRIQPLF